MRELPNQASSLELGQTSSEDYFEKSMKQFLGLRSVRH